jgi:hypothetical protein
MFDFQVAPPPNPTSYPQYTPLTARLAMLA